MSVEAVELGTAVEVTEPVETPVLPIMEHAAKFSEAGRAKEAEALANETPEEKTAKQVAAAQQKRDKESGEFREGKTRHRAASQQASPEDVPRIRELTAKANTAEARATAAEAEVARLKAAHAPAADVKRAEVKADAAVAKVTSFYEAEPTEDDPKFGGDYGKYLRATAAWEGRKAYHEERQAERDTDAKAAKQAEADQAVKTFGERVTAAQAKHQDFDAVAFGPTPIKANSVADAFIMEDDNGAEVLYYLHSTKNRQELDALLMKPVFEQVKHLALLSQRLAPDSSTQAADTRSVAGRKTVVVLPPKPPNLVRTEAQRTSGGPPPTDGSLGVLAHAKQFKRS